MDYVDYLRERALEFRNLAITTRDARACQALHHLADICAALAAALRGRDEPLHGRARPNARLRAEP